MRNLLVLILLGIALVQLSGIGATEQEVEKQISVLENEADLQVQELAEAGKKTGQKTKKRLKSKGKRKGKKGPRKHKSKGKRKGKSTKKSKGNKKRKNRRKGKVNKKRKNRKNGKVNKKRKSKKNRQSKKKRTGKKKGKSNKKRKSKKNRKSKKKRTVKKKGKSNKKRKSKKRRKSKKKRNRKKKSKGKKKRRNQSKQGTNGTGGAGGAGGCETGCSDLLVGMMKALRKQNTYLKQFNRIVKGQQQAKKKGLKQSNFDSNATDGPLNLLITAGGGNKSAMTCAGSKTNKAALLMANLTAKLGACKADIASKCNATKMITIKSTWTACNTSMLAFKAAADTCMKSQGPAACACFNKTNVSDLKKKVDKCDAVEMQKASLSDGKIKKTCIKTYGGCRQSGEGIRPVLSNCQPGGKTVEEMVKEIGQVEKNKAANDAVKKKAEDMVKSAGRKSRIKREDLIFLGTTYNISSCSGWIDAANAWLDALIKDQVNDISAYGASLAAASGVICTSADIAKLTSLAKKAVEVATKIVQKQKKLQAQVAKVSGSTANAAAAASAIVSSGGSSGSGSGSGSGGSSATKAGRRRHKILAEFRQRL